MVLQLPLGATGWLWMVYADLVSSDPNFVEVERLTEWATRARQAVEVVREDGTAAIWSRADNGLTIHWQVY